MRKRSISVAMLAAAASVASFLPAGMAAADDGVVYTQPGGHLVNGRYWKTSCEMYSSNVVRCRTDIFATKVVTHNGRHYSHQGWVFNNLTYLPSARTSWGKNPLANNGEFVGADGRKWKTECDTAATGRNGCRSYAWSDVIAHKDGKFVAGKQWVFNNIVAFATDKLPAVTSIPAAAPAIDLPVEKKFVAPASASGATPVTVTGGVSSCKASYYWQPQMTASGERFNPNALTTAHKTLPLGTRLKVTNPANGKSVVVRVNDRGPYIGGRCLDLSRAAMSAIGGTSAGVITVNYQRVS